MYNPQGGSQAGKEGGEDKGYKTQEEGSKEVWVLNHRREDETVNEQGRRKAGWRLREEQQIEGREKQPQQGV